MTRLTAEQLAALIDRYAGPLELYARQWTVEAADVVQDAFVALIDAEPLPVQPVAWLYRTVRNRALNARRGDDRRGRREREAAKRDVWTSPERTTDIDLDELTDALTMVPDEMREVIVARLWGELTYQEIASMTGTSVSTVHRRYEGGIDILRKRLGISWEIKTTRNQ